MVSRGWLGLGWAVTAGTATMAGAPWLAAWMALGAGAAAAQVAASSRREPNRSLLALVAAAVGALVPLAALAGLRLLAVAVAAGVLVVLLGRAAGKTPTVAAEAARALAGAVAIGVGMAGVVVVAVRSPEAALFLLACAAAYDTGAYLVGTGASSWWEGPAAGMAAVIPVTLLAASLDVVATSTQSVQLGVVAAGLAPVGPLVAQMMLVPGTPLWRAPTLRRLDSLLVLAPVWVVFALRFLPPPAPAT